MASRSSILTALTAVAVLAVQQAPGTAMAATAPAEDGIEFFEQKVRPVLARNCYGCHDEAERAAGLDLTSVSGFVTGSEAGPIVEHGDPAASRLMEVLGYQGRIKMPPRGRLPAGELADIRTWIEMGAPWPGADEISAAPKTRRHGQAFTDAERAFWFYQPIVDPQPPAVRQESWVRTPIDRFVLSRLEKEGLEPAEPADRAALLRRLAFDLTGLPPGPEAVRRLLQSDSDDAIDREIEDLLASPRYGERYGRHWLDVARYADSTGNDEDHRYPWAYRYRDYVIRSFNEDLPYDQFVREQLAGDLLPPLEGEAVNRNGIIATGLLALGPKAIAQQDKQRMLYDVWDEQVDVVSRAFMGLTMACARCHDHKFDPIPTRDYYGLVGMFASTRSFETVDSHVSSLLHVPLVEPELYERWRQEQRAIRYTELSLEAIGDRAAERAVEPLIDSIANSMLAAAAVYLEGGEPEAVATAHRLDLEALNAWVRYLQPQDEVVPHLEAWQAATADRRAEIATEYQESFRSSFESRRTALSAWRIETAEAGLERPLPPPPERPALKTGDNRFYYETYALDGPLRPSREQRRALLVGHEEEAEWIRQEALFEDLRAAAMPRPEMADAVTEGPAVDQAVLIRGDYTSPGEPAPKVFPTIVAGEAQVGVSTGSGRRELADWLVDPGNPLVARVMVNRIWSWHFGEGLVRTPNNFGRLGDRPSHPELLDWLAARFIESGWSIKALNRLILQSNVYRTSSIASDAAWQADPENRLLARFPRRRLDVEEIRDTLLIIDGSLDERLGGTLQEGFGTDGENSNGRLSFRPEDSHRRTVYLPLRRANLPALLNLFDFGDAVTSQGKRQTTNVAPQALFLMNSRFVHDRSAGLAEDLVESRMGDAQRAEEAYLRVLARPPSEQEGSELVSYQQHLRAAPERPLSARDAWASAIRVLLASNEFMYVD